jgi:hypothetical protein
MYYLYIGPQCVSLSRESRRDARGQRDAPRDVYSRG